MKLLNIHSHHKSNDTSEEVVYNEFIQEFVSGASLYSVGLHPWHLEKIKLDLPKLRAAAKEAVAIGETGFDRLIATPLERQWEVFEAHAALATELSLPLIIHCVKAFDQLQKAKKQGIIKTPAIVHGFNNKASILNDLLDMGFYISLGKAALLPNSNAAKAATQVPLNQLFIETDDAPNEMLPSIYAQIASLRNISIEELATAMHENGKTIGLGKQRL